MNTQKATIPPGYIEEVNNKDIAVIGISAKFPMADDIKDYWNNISCKIDCISKIPSNRKDYIDDYFEFIGKSSDCKYMNGGYLQKIQYFDHEFFSISPNEAKLMAPQQRMLLETTWNAFEDAGYRTSELSNQKIAVFLGHIGDLESYKYKEMAENIDASNAASAFTGTLPSIASGRISNLLNINGPNFIIDSACSSSLVSIATACQALSNRSCDMALITSVRINLLPIDDVKHKIGIESTDYITRAFDDNADGSGIGEGVAAIVLKPLWKAIEDKDNIYAVVKGYGVNHDGRTASLTAPNPKAQEELLVKTWLDSGIDPRTISYMELHGTGTKLGDPIEMQAIRQAFERFTKDKQFCAVSTVKSNIGHLYECSGLAGFIKASLSLKNKVIPASLHFLKPNQHCNLYDSPVYINTNTRNWEVDKQPRRCTVSSFGLSGTNCHIILEEYNTFEPHQQKTPQQEIKILTASAKTITALYQKLKCYMNFLLKENINIDNFLFTANTGRDIYQYKAALYFSDIPDLIQTLSKLKTEEDFNLSIPSLCFGFTKNNTTDKVLSDTKLRKIIDQYITSDFTLSEAAKEICSSFVKGITIDWNLLYQNKEVHKISIPAYPFQVKPFWLDVPTTKENDIMYSMEWKKEEKAPFEPLKLAGQTILIIGKNPSLLSSTFTEKFRIIRVEIGKEYQKKNSLHYIISSQFEDYCRLFDELKNQKIGHIIHNLTNKPLSNDRKDISEDLDNGVFSLFYTVKAIFTCGLSGTIDITILTYLANRVTGDEISYSPCNGAVDGLGKVVSKEYPNITCRCFDVDESTTAEEFLSEFMIRRKEYHVAFRKHTKYFEYMKELPLDTFANDTSTIRSNGVYLITGGTGNIGLCIARHIADYLPKYICLLHHKPLPERNLWNDILKESKDSKLIRVIETIQSIEKKGVKVFCYALDISCYETLKEILKKIQNECGKINGIIHAAGVPGQGLLFTKSREAFTSVLYPKTLGTYYLDSLTRKDPPDFMMLFSSGLSTVGEVGQGDYTAANCFLDTYSYYRNRSGLRTTVIDWVVWENSRMLEGKSPIIDGIFKELSTEKAINAFDKILGKKIERVFVGEINRAGDANNEYIGDIPFEVPDVIRNKIKKGNKSTWKSTSYSLEGRHENQYSEEERHIADLYHKILGYDKLNIYDSFFEMGGNSIQISQLYAELQEIYPSKFKISDLFQYTSINKLAECIEGKKPKSQQNTTFSSTAYEKEEIAVIGMALNLPEAENLKEFWNNMLQDTNCSKKLSGRRKENLDKYLQATKDNTGHKEYMVYSYLDNIDEFDYSFFHISPKEAKRMEPGQRLFLQTAWHALEDAGYARNELSESRTGVYLGYANIYKDSYQKMIYDISPELFEGAVVGNLSAAIPARISYLLNLKGPSMLIDTACSSSLTSIHLACNAIRNGDCDMAIAGGLKLFILPFMDERFHLGIESKDGMTRSFDADSDGAGMGEGVAAVILKPLSKAIEDKDSIYAIIKGSSINQDGSTQGLTAPNPSAQTDVILRAWENGKIHPETISYFEAHGTGTSLGDPIEVEGLTKAFEKFTNKKQFCAIGSAKSTIGHLNECSGIAGFIKAVLVANNHIIPPARNFNRPNAKIDFANSPVYVNTHARRINNGESPIRCAISSFGLSGTNCHIVLEEYQNDYVQYSQDKIKTESSTQIFTLSALSLKGLLSLVKQYLEFIVSANTVPSLEAICFTANYCRNDYTHRLAMPVHDTEDLIKNLTLIDNSGFENLNGTTIYYGCQKSVCMEADKQKLASMGQEVTEILNHFTMAKYLSTTEINLICEYYAKGGEIDWGKMYSFHKPKKVHLPMYPFEKNICWIPLPTAETVSKEDIYHSIKWEPNTKNKDLIHWKNTDKQVLIIANKSQRLNECQLILEAGNYAYTVCQPNMAEYIEYADLIKYQMVIFLMFYDSDDIESLQLLEDSQHKGVLQLFAIAKKLIQQNWNKQLDFVLISDSVYKVLDSDCTIKPQAASMFGLGKVLNKECNTFFCRCIDVDNATKLMDTVSVIFDFGNSFQSAYRKGTCYTEIFTKAELQSSRSKISIRKNGVYVITGGTGDLAQKTAIYLSTKAPVTLILLSRKKGQTSDKVLHETIKRITDNGSKVILCQSDITKTNETKAVLDEVRKKYGSIQGVIHTAGITETKPMIKKDVDGIKKVMAPKLQGTWIMDHLTREDNLDFFVVFTSTATICYSAEQCDYIAANTFMEAYCNYRNTMKDNSIVIHWTTWKETGMAARQGFNIDTIFKTIGTKDALKAFDFVVENNLSSVVIGKINYGSSTVQLLKNYPYRLSDEIQKQLDQKENSPNDFHGLPNATAKNEVIKVISAICEEYLESANLSEEDTFFELGCDSILLKQIHQRLNQYYPGVIQMTDLFEYSTIKNLADYIKSQNNVPMAEKASNEHGEQIEKILDDMETGKEDVNQVIDKLLNL